MQTPSADYCHFLSHCSLSTDAIDALLGEGDARTRMQVAMGLRDEACQARLFELAALSPHKPSLDDICPPGQTVTFEGRNTLPVFSRFKKVFFHPPGEARLIGYNRQCTGILTGPGYYQVTRRINGVLDFDYTKLPAIQPKGFPRLTPNAGGIGGLVYGGLRDDVAALTKNILIGRARKGNKTIGYFILAR